MTFDAERLCHAPSPLFLASVRSVEEARLATTCGADIIDCKNPDDGALGALPIATVAAIRRAVPKQIPVSATVGDLIPDDDALPSAVRAMASSGADIIKIGFFGGGNPASALKALKTDAAKGLQLAGLLLADMQPDWSLVGAMAEAGFKGVMVDTAGKQGGSLIDHASPGALGQFLHSAHEAGLFAGFAGSLRAEHLPVLLPLKPDILGFRGALCHASNRRGELDRQAILALRGAIPSAPVLKQALAR